ncbi:mycothiol-dependent nitroreductase Rv2466c family protein [Mycobacterium sp.]|uniref:mycothiol-dependent nitroreductase Rv2466c family protein n=1 Tax=Mycobacterium sp. TaxID=1785 RepID=UPI003F9DFFC0
MVDVDLYLDPICPFAWVASRWLLDAAETNQTPVTLRQMSLAVLNEGKELDAKQQGMMNRSRRLGRLFAAVAAEHGPDAFARLYDSIGARMHVLKEEIDAGAIREALAENGLEESLADAVDQSKFDDVARQAHGASQKVLGGPGGSPIIAVDGRAFHGPVLTGVPNKEDGVHLLEAVVAAARIPEFALLQRPFQGPPIIEEGPR